MNKKVPRIRFTGFSEEFEQKKLGELGKTFTGLSGKTKEDFGHGDADFVTYMNVFSNSISDPNMVESIEIDSKQNQVKYGDVFFTTSSETPEEVGMSSVWLGNEEDIYLNSFCFGFRPKDPLDPYYLAFMLRSPSVRKSFVFLAQGISRYNISKIKAMDIIVPVPELQEQKKIGLFIHQINDFILLHQNKINILLEIKQGFLQKMFPKNGEMKPEIRFSGFTDDWEQRELENISKYRNGKAHEQVENKNGEYTIINSKFISTDGNVKRHTNSMIEPVFKGEITIVLSDLPNGKALAKVFLVKEDYKYTLNQRIASITPNENIDALFLSYRLNRNSYFLKFDSGVSQTNLSKSQVESFSSLYPNYEEQKKIGNFIQNIDDSITLHQRELELLEQIKKAFVQKIFV